MTRDEVIAGIERLKPWYQRIEFPEFGIAAGISQNGSPSPATDNRFDGLSQEEASRLRPIPKWKRIAEQVRPYIEGKTRLSRSAVCQRLLFVQVRRDGREVRNRHRPRSLD